MLSSHVEIEKGVDIKDKNNLNTVCGQEGLSIQFLFSLEKGGQC